jgi:hypothetical protein
VPDSVVAAGEQAVEEFISYFASHGWGESTLKVYLSAVRRFFRFTEGRGLALGEVTAEEVRAFLEDLSVSARGLTSPLLRGVFDRFASAGVIEESPAASVKGSDLGPSLSELKAVLRHSGPALDEGSEEFQAALVLLAALFRGNKDLLALSQFTGVPLERIEEYGARLREAGIWLDDNMTCCCWGEPDGKGDIAFWLDVLIALGLVKKLGDDKYTAAGSASE